MIRLGLGLPLIPARARVTPTSVPINSALPSITGIRTQGQTVTVSPGTWIGLPSASFTYQWKRAGSNIGGGTNSTYVLTGTDVGQAITVTVIASNSVGPSLPATSASITPAATLTISGTPGAPTVGSAYTFTPSSSGGHTPKTFALTGTLPSGLSFSTSTGAITGTPLSTGTASGLNITVTDADGLTAALGTFSLVVTAPGLGPDIVTDVEVLGDISIAITNPASINVDMPTNGICMKITTSGSAAHTALNLALPPVAYCRTRGHDAGGNVVWQNHAITLGAKLLGPYNEKTAYQPNLGEFYLVADNIFYNQDATWKTEVLSVYFPAGWLLGRPEAQVDEGDITRSDSRTFDPFPMRDISIPFYDAVTSGGTFHFEALAVSPHSRNMSQVACIKAWLVDKDSAAGPVSTISSMTLSSYTPGTEPGRPLPSYQAELATTGLAQGRMHTRHTVYPWLGPPQDSETYGLGMGDYVAPVKGVPIWLDLDGSYVRLYGILSQDPTAATIAADTVVPVDTTGLSLTIAGAIASGKTYATEATILRAVQTVNNSAVPVTIADAAGAAVSYQRTTIHNDCAGASVVYRPVVGSVPGANTGAYCLRTQLSTYVPGEVAPEFRSEDGVFSDDVRVRGVDAFTGSPATGLTTYNSRHLPLRHILRGLYLDAVGSTTDANNPAFSRDSSSDATVYTEDTVLSNVLIDVKIRGRTGAADSFDAYQHIGRHFHVRVDWEGDRVQGGLYAQNHYSFGNYAALGSKYNSRNVVALKYFYCVGGCHTINLGTDGTVLGTTVPKPYAVGRIFVNWDQEFTALTGLSRINVVAADDNPVKLGEGWLNVLCHSTVVGAGNFTSWNISNDFTTAVTVGVSLQHCGAFFPNQTDTQSARLNFDYNDVGWIGVTKRTSIKGSYFPGYNIKGDSFGATGSATTAPARATHSTAVAWNAGRIVRDAAGTLAYQAKQDVPIGVALTDTDYWYAGGSATTAFGQQPRRQGDLSSRYQVGFTGVVTVDGADGSTAGSSIAWVGYHWGGSNKVNSTKSAWMSSGFTPSASGDLANRVAEDMAPAPFDLFGTAFANDGSDFSGPVQG